MPLWVPSLKSRRGNEFVSLFRVDVIKCSILRKLNRFVVEVKVGNDIKLAHNSNTGRLLDLIWEGNECFCSLNGGRRTHCKLVAARVFMDSFAVLDTRIQEIAFKEALERGLLPWLRGYKVIKRAPKFGSSVFDFQLVSNEGKIGIVELKSADLKGEYEEGMWPDCPTQRGVKQIKDLISLRGYDKYLVFVVGFDGACCFRPFEDGHPGITDLILEAMKSGVNVKAIGLGLDEVTNYVYLYDSNLPLKLM
ncbi:DNA/RNA nuclease SfsA [Ignicoccus islandicus]|nr:DNA/RNA nuclease SfsA [Ignicoccus islandicus]